MYLITIQGDVRGQHIPLALCDSHSSIDGFIMRHTDTQDWSVTLPTKERPIGAIDTGPHDNVSYVILLVEPNTPILGV